MKSLPKFVQDFLLLFNRMERAKKMMRAADYERNRAIIYGEQYGAWVAEYHLWKNIDANRAKAAMTLADRYLRRAKRYAAEMFARYRDEDISPEVYE